MVHKKCGWSHAEYWNSQLKRIDQAIEGLQLNLDDQSWFDIYTAIIGQDIP